MIKDFISAEERLKNMPKKYRILDKIYMACSTGIIILFFYEFLNGVIYV